MKSLQMQGYQHQIFGVSLNVGSKTDPANELAPNEKHMIRYPFLYPGQNYNNDLQLSLGCLLDQVPHKAEHYLDAIWGAQQSILVLGKIKCPVGQNSSFTSSLPGDQY